MLGEVPDSDLPALYSGALACVYPSLYEGFGLPVLEAMQCGALVITSRDPAILEVSGDAAVHVDAEDTAALVEAMRAVADESGRLRRSSPTSPRARGAVQLAEDCSPHPGGV